MKKLRVTIEGKTYEVLVEVLDDPTNARTASPIAAPVSIASAASVTPAPVAPTPVAAPPPAVTSIPASTGTPAAAGDVPCPLTGKVVSIDVKVGDAVKEGAQVATVEAMKMNTYVYAPRSGRVSAVFVNPGDGVEEGKAILRIE